MTKKPWWKSPFLRYLALTVFYWLHLLGAACLFTLLVKPEKVQLFERFWVWVLIVINLCHFWHWVITGSWTRSKPLTHLDEREEEVLPPPPYKGVVGHVGTGIRTRVVDTTMSDLPPVARGHREQR